MKRDFQSVFMAPLVWTAGMLFTRLLGLYASPSASLIAVSIITAAFIIKNK